MKKVVLDLDELCIVDKTRFWGDEDFDEKDVRITTLRDISAILYRSPHGIMWELAYKIHQITGFDYDELAKAIDKIVEEEEKITIQEATELFLSNKTPKPSEKYFD